MTRTKTKARVLLSCSNDAERISCALNELGNAATYTKGSLRPAHLDDLRWHLTDRTARATLGGMSDLYLKQLRIGPMANFVYLVGSLSKRSCYVVDPAWDLAAIKDAASADDMRLAGALVTHYHPDHCGGHLWGHDIAGVAELAHDLKIPVYAHADELDGIVKVTGLSRQDIKSCQSGDKLQIGGVDITLIHTPGHTPGSQCFLCEDNLIAGDTLFITGCGRVDLPGGNSEQLFDSLANKLGKLSPATRLYPGHNYDPVEHATLAEVRRVNPYLSANSLANWRQLFGNA